MPDLAAAWRFLEDSDLVASAQQVDDAIARLAQEISARLAKTYPVILAVMGGAIVFAGQLLPRLRFPMDFDYLHVTRYGAATEGSRIEWKVAPPAGVRGRPVLVLDDILDAGQTMRAIQEEVRALGAASFQCAVLVEKMHARPKPIRADFVGLEIEDRFVFGCGMDAKGFWRNLPEIRAMKGT